MPNIIIRLQLASFGKPKQRVMGSLVSRIGKGTTNETIFMPNNIQKASKKSKALKAGVKSLPTFKVLEKVPARFLRLVEFGFVSTQ